MRVRIQSYLLLLYGIVAALLIFFVLLLAFDFSNNILGTVASAYRAEVGLMSTFMRMSRLTFPHLYWLHFLILVFALYGFGVLAVRYIAPALRQVLVRYMDAVRHDRHRLFTFILITGVLIFSLIAGECGLRFSGRYDYHSMYFVQKGWLHVFDRNDDRTYVAQGFTQHMVSNSLGYPDREWSKQKKDSIRIASFGDSFTEGVGTAMDSGYPHILGQLMPHSDVLNFGVSGSDPVFSYMALRQTGLAYQPDIATFAINTSDILEVEVRGGFERFRADSTTHTRQPPWWEPLYDLSYISRVLLPHVYSFDRSSHLPAADMGAERVRAAHMMEQAMDSCHALCMAHGIRCVFIFHPCCGEVLRARLDCSAEMQYARSRGYEVIDILEAFRRHGIDAHNADKYFWPIDRHNNGTGYHLLAEVLKDSLSVAGTK